MPRAGSVSDRWVVVLGDEVGAGDVVAGAELGAPDDDGAADVEVDVEGAEDEVGAEGVDDDEDADAVEEVLGAGVVGAGAVDGDVLAVVMSSAGAWCPAFSRLAHDQAVALLVLSANENVPLPVTAPVTSALAQLCAVTGPVTPAEAAPGIGAVAHVMVCSLQSFGTTRRVAPSPLLLPAQHRNTARVTS